MFMLFDGPTVTKDFSDLMCGFPRALTFAITKKKKKKLKIKQTNK